MNLNLLCFQSTLEYDVFKDIQANVKSHYVNGLPLHRLPLARLPDPDPKGSAIFICNWDDFQKYTAVEVQAIFRHRHILLRNGPV